MSTLKEIQDRHDEKERLYDAADKERGYPCDLRGENKSHIDRGELLKMVEKLEAQLEAKDMQLAACMTVASANTRESAKKVRDMHPDYRCAAVEDVERAVDREMEYREQLEAVRGRIINLPDKTYGFDALKAYLLDGAAIGEVKK